MSARSVVVSVGAAVGIAVSQCHVDSGGLEKSTWSKDMELVYSLIGTLVIALMLNAPNSETTQVVVIMVASAITAYHLVLAIRKGH